MKAKTKELILEAKNYLDGGRVPQDILFLASDLRIRKQYKLVRDVVKKYRESCKDKPCPDELIFTEAFAWFKDHDLPSETCWEGAEKTLAMAQDQDVPDAESLKYAIKYQKATQKGRVLIQQIETLIRINRSLPAKEMEEKHEDLLNSAKELKGFNSFHYARRLFQLAANYMPGRKKEYIRQQHALCTYKDPDLPLTQRLNSALHILNGTDPKNPETDPETISGGLLAQSEDPETLGLAGAIYKNKWDAETRKSDLEKSYNYYNRGHQADMKRVNWKELTAEGEKQAEGDLKLKPDVNEGHSYGYPGINAAYVLDQLGIQENNPHRHQEAFEIRSQLTGYLSALLRSPNEEIKKDKHFDHWWVLVTLIEAYFGLKKYSDADKLLNETNRPTELWKIESFVRQLVLLVHNQVVDIKGDGDDAKLVRQVLKNFLGAQASLLDNMLRGKVGLALSGGGFRASLYHIGVLAKLAEIDLLRHVEVISSVSGGSIISAHYYLEVRNLLQSQEDKTITKQQYVDIVKRVADDFVKGTQKNIRMRVISNLITNLKMMLFPTYSRTVRSGELYERWIYSKVPDGEGDGDRYLSELYVEPKGAPLTFRPKTDNWRRKNKVPILVVNATTLNTGNNWHFTASWMGEPPPVTEKEMDGKTRLRRTYYREAPEKHQRYRLGNAVSSSACVPGLFEPIVLTGLYKDNYTVRLVDGGVYDNQGINGLLDQGCNVILVSDASGQIKAQADPGGGALGPVFRINSISMERIRKAQFKGLDVQLYTGMLNNCMQVHLKKDLGGTDVEWLTCTDSSQNSQEANDENSPTHYNILRGTQAKLAAIRTDLDSFSDAEAYALMTSGYLMTEEAVAADLKGIVPAKASDPFARSTDWDFLKVEKAMASKTEEPEKYNYLNKILKASSKGAMKIFSLKPLQAYFALLVVLVVLGTAGFVAYKFIADNSLGKPLLLGVGIFLAVLFVIKVIVNIITFRTFGIRLLLQALLSVISATFFAFIGWIVVFIHLVIFDKMFLAYGKKDKL